MNTAQMILGIAISLAAGWGLGLVLRANGTAGRPWSILSLLFAALSALVAGVLAAVSLMFMNGSAEAVGEVIAIEEGTNLRGEKIWTMMATYRDQTDEQHETEQRMKEGEFKVGGAVPLRFRPEKPKRVRIDSWQRHWGAVSLATLSSLFLLGLSVGWKRWSRRGEDDGAA